MSSYRSVARVNEAPVARTLARLGPAGSMVGAAALPALLLRVPWGAIAVAIVALGLAYLGYRRFQRWAAAGGTPSSTLAPESDEPAPPGGGAGSNGSAWDESSAGESGTPSSDAGSSGARAPAGSPSVVPPTPSPGLPVAFAWRPETGVRPLTGYTPPKTVSQRSPSTTGFGLRVVLIFLGVAIALALLHRVVFLGMDEFVRVLGAVLYWPRPWPGVLVHPTLSRTLPDYVLLMYLSMMLAICLSTRIFSDARYAGRQRENAALLIIAYILAAALTDAVAFAFPERLVASAFLLVRALLGGAVLALLLFSILRLPAPILVKRVFGRDRTATLIVAVTVLLSLLLSAVVLVLLYQHLGFGRRVIPFAVLLMLPFLALVFFGAIGRLIYAAEVRRRPVPRVADFHPTVSIIIPAYNEQANVALSVASADEAARLYPGTTEILVANDGSTDRTSQAARLAISRLRHATGAVLDLPHGGKSNALNAAVRSAKGEVIVRIDADSRISAQRGFSTLVPHLADPEVGGVQGLILPLQQTGWTRKLRYMEIAWNHLFLRRAQMATRTTQVVDGAFCAFRRADLLRVGGWVSWNGEDTEITLRLQRQGYRMRFETGAAAFEDVPEDFDGLRKQRIRWNRGGLFAHRRHIGGLFTDPVEFGGLATLLWLAFFIRGGLRGLIWVYAVVLLVIGGLPTLLDVLIISAALLVPRGLAIGYYLARLGRWRDLPFILAWPVTGSIKQYFSLEAFGTMLPGSAAEFAD